MQRDRMRASLEHLGIPPADCGVLKLLPLVWVAWADGKMEDVEKERILETASNTFGLSPEGLAILDEWLAHAPSHQYAVEALRHIPAIQWYY